MVSDFGVVGFGANSIEFAVELLAEKVERAADGFGGGEEFAKFLEVGGEAGELFGDIAAVAEEGDFFENTLVGGVDVETGVFESLGEEFSLTDGNGGGDLRDGFGEGLESDEALGEVGLEGLAFFTACDGKGFEGFGEGGFEGGEDLFEVVTFFDEELIGLAEEVLGGEVEGLSKVLGELVESGFERLGLGGVDF